MEAETRTMRRKWGEPSDCLLLRVFMVGVQSDDLSFTFFIYLKFLVRPPLAIPQSTLYYTSDETVFGESNSGERRYWVGIDDISPVAIQATVAIEDQTFYEHNGYDFKRIGGAVLANIKAGQKVQGASTITQQYARNLFLTMDKTWTRKISEAVYAARLEFHYNKKQILEGYLNTINFGHGAYGIESASQFYFGKNAKDLTLAEASLLMGIPKGPSNYSPLHSEEKAKKRQSLILEAMQKNGYIRAEEEKEAAAQKLTFIGKHPHHRADLAPYFYDAVQKELKINSRIG